MIDLLMFETAPGVLSRENQSLIAVIGRMIPSGTMTRQRLALFLSENALLRSVLRPPIEHSTRWESGQISVHCQNERILVWCFVLFKSPMTVLIFDLHYIHHARLPPATVFASREF